MTSILRAPRTAWIVAAAMTLLLIAALVWGFVSGAFQGANGGSYVAGAAQLADQMGGARALRLTLEGQYPGPLRDTVVQRWRDPVDGTICYIYLPIAVPHSAGPAGLVQYGQADIGSMSCFPGPKA
jgi:hypothetical protein